MVGTCRVTIFEGGIRRVTSIPVRVFRYEEMASLSLLTLAAGVTGLLDEGVAGATLRRVAVIFGNSRTKTEI